MNALNVNTRWKQRVVDIAGQAQEFESVLGLSTAITRANDMWETTVPRPQYPGASPNGELAPEHGFEP